MDNSIQLASGTSVQTSETAATAVATQAQAMIAARYSLAMKNPRDLDKVRQDMMKECRRPRFAQVARYHKPIGDGIDGPSIRFTEMGIRCMRNIETSTFTILDDEDKRIVRVCVNDIEANVPYSQDVTITKTVERRNNKGHTVVGERMNSKGYKVYIVKATDDDILNKQNALISKAVRTLGQRLIPGDITDECMDIVDEIVRNKIKEDPDTEKREIFDSFESIGISVDQVKQYLETDASNLSPKELVTLRSLYNAIKEGETTWKEVMELKTPKVGDVKTKQTLRQQYETLKLQLTQAGKVKEFNSLIKGHSEVSNRNEKTWTDSDLNFLIKNMKTELNIQK